MGTPFLTSDIAPIACEYKRVPIDFVVEEVPAFEPIGEGQHLWMRIEKRGMTTDTALGHLGRCLGVPRRKLRVGGKKDARAVTVQWVSLDLPPKDFAARLDQLGDGIALRILEVTMHRTGNAIGRTHGNRFRIRLRGLSDDRYADVRQVLDVLSKRGVPNYFGEQRFGHRGDTDRIGEAVLADRSLEAVQLILGRPSEMDTGRYHEAREAFEFGDLERAQTLWSGGDFAPKQLLRSLLKSGGQVDEASAGVALQSLDRRDLGFYGSAFQSRLFNEVLAQRVGGIDEIWEGDLALRLPGGRQSFAVVDVQAEQFRAAAGEISASGPLFGHKMPQPTGKAAEIEQAVLDANGWSTQAFEAPSALPWPGGRRALRTSLMGAECESGQDEDGSYFELRFQLPKGSYATCVLRELHKEV
jgi:tRNA pseudouridine13 synthase